MEGFEIEQELDGLPILKKKQADAQVPDGLPVLKKKVGGVESSASSATQLPSQGQIDIQGGLTPISTQQGFEQVKPTSKGVAQSIILTDRDDRQVRKPILAGALQGKIANILSLGKAPSPEELGEIADLNRQLQEIPASEASQAWEKDGLSIFKNPKLGLEFLAETIGSSLTSLIVAGQRTVPAAVGIGAASGSAIPAIGTAIGAGTGLTAGLTTAGANISTSQKLLELMSESGVDIADKDSLVKAFSDEKKLAEMRSKALKYGLSIALFDVAAAGVAGKLISGAAGKSIAKKVAAGLGEAGIQSFGGGAGEAVGQLASTGKINWKDVAVEAIASLATDLPDVVVGAGIERVKSSSSNKNLATQIAVLGKDAGIEDAKINLDRDLKNGVIDEVEYNEGLQFVEKAAVINDTIPETIQGESRAKAIELIDERQRLEEEVAQREEQKKNIDVAFHKALDEANKEATTRIEEINAEIEKLASKKQKVSQETVSDGNIEQITDETTQTAEAPIQEKVFVNWDKDVESTANALNATIKEYDLPPKNTALPTSPKTWSSPSDLERILKSELNGVVERGVSFNDWVKKGYSRQLSSWDEQTRNEFLEISKKMYVDIFSKEYHKAKRDGSNQNIVKALEDILGKNTEVTESEGRNVKNGGNFINIDKLNLTFDKRGNTNIELKKVQPTSDLMMEYHNARNEAFKISDKAQAEYDKGNDKEGDALMQKYKDKINESESIIRGTTASINSKIELQDVLPKEFIDKYPQLKNIEIKSSDVSFGSMGHYNKDTNTLHVITKRESFEKTLTHEIGHLLWDKILTEEQKKLFSDDMPLTEHGRKVLENKETNYQEAYSGKKVHNEEDFAELFAENNGDLKKTILAKQQFFKEQQKVKPTEVTEAEPIQEEGISQKGIERAEAKKIYKKVNETDIPNDADGIALSYLAGGGKVNEAAINEVAGRVKRARLNTGERELKSEEAKARDYYQKEGKSLDDIAHELWEASNQEVPESDIKNALMDAIANNNTRLDAAKQYLERYNPEYAEEQYYNQLYEQKKAEVEAEEAEINKWLAEEGEAEFELAADEEYINQLIKKYETDLETEIEQPTTESQRTSSEKVSSEESGAESQPKPTTTDTTVEPPKPPKPPKETGGSGEKPLKTDNKSILTRIYESENITPSVKEKFKDKLKYKVASQDEARSIAKEMVKEFGIDDAVTLAEAGKFDGDVNSFIFAEALDATYQSEVNAKTSQEKAAFAEKWADIAMRYDESARDKGRFIAAIADFYRKSPLGIKIAEEARRSEEFKKWFRNKEDGYKEVYEEIVADPEFKDYVKEEVQKELKKERAEFRKDRRKKIEDTFDGFKINKDALYAIPIPPNLYNVAVEAMKQAFLAGESIANAVEVAVEKISSEIKDWDKDKFRKEYQERLTKIDLGKKSKLTPEELTEEKRQKLLDKFRNKLKGLSEKEKDEVIRKAFKKLVENGALEYDDFKQIIAETIGLGQLTADETQRITQLVKDINDVEALANQIRQEDARSIENLRKYQDAKKKAEKSATELGQLVYNKPNIVNRLLSVMQLNTLGLPSLVNNPIFNIANQAVVRFPIGVQLSVLDQILYGASKVTNRIFGTGLLLPQNNVALSQKEFVKKLWQGSKQSGEQLFTGLTNKDYFQKEVYSSQIHPFTSAKELWDYSFKGKKLTPAQVADKSIQATVGIPAEVVARLLNIGDKPQRYAAEGAQAATFAKNLGLKDIVDYEYFLEFPKEEAFRKFKQQGLSDEAAMKKAEEIRDGIVKQGEESVFQQENFLNDVINQAFKAADRYGTVAGNISETIKKFNFPFLKIPLNAFWSYYNLANPMVALTQSAVYAAKAIKTKSPIDIQQSKKWAAHATTGMALMAIAGALAKEGIVNSDNDDETTKKERMGEQQYEQQKSINITKLKTYLNGQDPNKVENGLNVDLKWLGVIGNLLNIQANKLEEMTPEQKENGMSYMEDMLNTMTTSGLELIDNGVFSNASGLLTAINKGGGFADQYFLNLINMGTNIIQPAMFAQISRAQLPYYSQQKADDFYGQLQNSMLARSAMLRTLTGKYPPSKIGIWGDQMERSDNVLMKLFSVSKSNKDNFAQPIYEDYKRTGNTKFFPPSVMPMIDKQKLNTKEAREFEILVGQSRKKLITPYINDGAILSGFKNVYSKLNDEDKIKALEIIYEEGFKDAKEEFVKLYPKYKKDESIESKIQKRQESRQSRIFRRTLK